MWSQRVQYAIRILIILAAQGNTRVSSREISERYEIPRKYLETILAELRQDGFVQSSRGKAGGYRLAREPSTIRFSEIITALEPDWFSASDSGEGIRDGIGANGETRPEEPALRELHDSFLRRLREVTVLDALMRWQERRRALMYSI